MFLLLEPPPTSGSDVGLVLDLNPAENRQQRDLLITPERETGQGPRSRGGLPHTHCVPTSTCQLKLPSGNLLHDAIAQHALCTQISSVVKTFPVAFVVELFPSKHHQHNPKLHMAQLLIPVLLTSTVAGEAVPGRLNTADIHTSQCGAAGAARPVFSQCGPKEAALSRAKDDVWVHNPSKPCEPRVCDAG